MEVTERLLANLHVLHALKGFGPQKLKALHDAGIRAGIVLQNPSLLPTLSKNGDNLRGPISKISAVSWAAQAIYGTAHPLRKERAATAASPATINRSYISECG